MTSSSNDSFPSFWDNPNDDEPFVRALPKIELHVHLDGSFDPKLLWNHLQKHPELLQCFPVKTQFYGNRRLRDCVANCQSFSEYRRLTSIITRRRRKKKKNEHNEEKVVGDGDSHQRPNFVPTLADMLLCFEFFLPLVYNSPSGDFLEELAYDFVKRQAEQNIIYTEVRYAPHFLHKDPRQAVEYVTKGLRRGCSEYPHVIVNQILCAINFQPENTPQVLSLTNEYFHQFPCAVVGMDIAAGEDHFDTDSHLKALLSSSSEGETIPFTLHAGEVPERGGSNVVKAIETYGARRIGHGYQIIQEDPKVLNELIQKYPKTHFETCLDSSVQTGGWIKEPKSTSNDPSPWMDHPANTFLQKGISMSINSDDPSVFNTSLTWQWRTAIQKMKWTRQDCHRVLLDTIQASFATNDEQEILQRRVTNFFETNNTTDNGDAAASLVFTDRVHYEDE